MHQLLASSSFEKYGLLLIIFGKQPISTLSKMRCLSNFPRTFTFTYFICF